MDIWRSIAGVLEVELTSAEPEKALSAVNAAEIEIFEVHQVSELTYRFKMSRKKYSKLERFCKKRGETLRIINRSGIYWICKQILTRPALLCGTAFLLFFVLYLPTRVFFFRVEGNTSVPSVKILAAAEGCGICFGASRREVRSEKVKNALLSAVPELQWAGVNTYGSVAVISVRERTDPEIATEDNGVTSIVAARDGYILSGTVTQGNGLFSAGQTVKAGQVLISGYTDCGICIRATGAKGEIIAQTNRNLQAITPSDCLQRDRIRAVKRKFSLLVRKKRINLWKDSGISDVSCGRMYQEYYFMLPGGFQLPVALCVEKFFIHETQEAKIPQSEAEKKLETFSEKYLMQQMVAGVIQTKSCSVFPEDGAYRFHGDYVCVEMIGRVQREQIGDINGKNG